MADESPFTLEERIVPRTCEKALFFQPDNKPKNDSYATHFMTPLPGGPSAMTSYTLSAWFNVQNFRDTTYAFSYATSDDKHNLLNFRLKAHKLMMVLSGVLSNVTYETVDIFPKVWYHLGLIVNQTGDYFGIYLNGEVKTYGAIKSSFTPLNGSLVLGQETDRLNGGFMAQQSFSGHISRFNLYGRVLKPEEIKRMSDCATEPAPEEGDLVSWSSTKWTLHGAVVEEDVTICPRKEVLYNVIVKQMNFPDANRLCMNLFKSDVYVPKNQNWNDQLYKDTSIFTNKCKPQNHGSSYFWLGATDEIENGIWRDMKGNLLNFTKFPNSKFSVNQKCVAFEAPPYFGIWNDVFCKSLTFCFACENTLVSLQMRGICGVNGESLMFRIGGMSSEGTRNIEGFTRYNIVFNQITSTWSLNDTWNEQLIATLFEYDGSYPIGTREWNLETDYAVCGLMKDQPKKLTLSACDFEEFTCYDGSCVPLSKRCDLKADCRDSSDENDCQILRLPSDYMKVLPPPGFDGGNLDVNLSVTVEKISEVDVLNMKVRIDFTIKMSWYDPRLTFANLNEIEDINVIDTEDVWTPSVEYTNADFPSVHEKIGSLNVLRKSAPMEDDPSRHLRDDYYEGESNPIILTRQVNAHFDCLMDLVLYPFDSQECRINIRLMSGKINLVTWGNLKVAYTGERELSEYEIQRIKSFIGMEREYSMGIVSMMLDRRYTYYLTSVYVPTLMMVIISYMSLFCDLENRDLRIMMTITTLLVLYSLYQQISNALPKTSYAKAVDVWCFFSLSVICSLVFFHVMVDLDGACDICRCFSTSHKVRDRSSILIDANSHKKRVLRFGRIAYMMFILTFSLGYFVVIALNVN